MSIDINIHVVRYVYTGRNNEGRMPEVTVPRPHCHCVKCEPMAIEERSYSFQSPVPIFSSGSKCRTTIFFGLSPIGLSNVACKSV